MKQLYVIVFLVLIVARQVGASESNHERNQEVQRINNVSENSTTITPVLIEGYYMGGVVNGKYYSEKEFYSKYWEYVTDIQYDIYVDDEYIDKAEIDFSYAGEEYGMDDLPYVANLSTRSLAFENTRRATFDLALKADWDLFPRPYREQDTRQAVYQRIVKDALRKKGIENPRTTITQLIRVDLDGDGTEEALIVAGSEPDEGFSWYTKKGENAIVIMRKLTDGVVWEQIVTSDLTLEESGYRNLFEIETIADIDGDGVMEVVVSSRQATMGSIYLYKLVDDQLELIASNGYGD